MKKYLILLLTALLLLSSCGTGAARLTEDYTLPHGITVYAPKGWEAFEGGHEFEIYLETESRDLFFGVYLYPRDELPQNMTTADFFVSLNGSMLSQSQKTAFLRQNSRSVLDGRTLYSCIYASEENGKEYAYYFGTVDYTDVLVWFVGSCAIDTMDDYEATLDRMLESITRKNS